MIVSPRLAGLSSPAFAALFLASPAASQQAFVAPSPGCREVAFPVPQLLVDGPGGTVCHDLDGDGDTDLAAGGEQGLTVWLQGRPGRYETSTTYSVGTSGARRAEVAADADGDGDIDVFGLYVNAPRASLFLNDGNGGFASHVVLPTPSVPLSLAVGDLNGDGAADLVLSVSGQLIVRLKTGPVGFLSYDTPTSYPVVGGDLGLVDLDGDEDLDLVVTSSSGTALSILRNGGDGTFGSGESVPAGLPGDRPVRVRTGDLDGDGDVDLLVSGTAHFFVLENLGDGTFAPQVEYPAEPDSRTAALADVDGDGDLDLVMSQLATAALYENLGDGSFDLLGLHESVGNTPVDVDLADLDGDGDPDLVFTNPDDDTLSLLSNAGAGVFGTGLHLDNGGLVAGLAFGDVAGDSRPDLISVDRLADRISIHRNLGGAFAPPTAHYGGNGPILAAAGDLDRDGDGDLVVATQFQQLLLLRNQGDGSFSLPEVLATTGFLPLTLALEDMDGDADLDVVVAASPSIGTTTVTIAFNQGPGGGFLPIVASLPTSAEFLAVAVGELVGDHLPDLAVILKNGNTHAFATFENLGSGSFVADASRTILTPFEGSLALGDLDGDGRLDAVLTNHSGLGATPLAVLLRRGSGFSAPQALATGRGPHTTVIADLDRDGDLDLAVSCLNGAGVRLHFNAGRGTFPDQEAAAANPNADSPMLALDPLGPSLLAHDFNGDGTPDLVVRAATSLQFLRARCLR